MPVQSKSGPDHPAGGMATHAYPAASHTGSVQLSVAVGTHAASTGASPFASFVDASTVASPAASPSLASAPSPPVATPSLSPSAAVASCSGTLASPPSPGAGVDASTLDPSSATHVARWVQSDEDDITPQSWAASAQQMAMAVARGDPFEPNIKTYRPRSPPHHSSRRRARST